MFWQKPTTPDHRGDPGGENRRFLAGMAAILGVAALLFGCTPLPRPFEHDTTNDLLMDQKAIAPLAIRPLPAVPGLTDALAKALEGEDIAATTADIHGSFTELTGSLSGPPAAATLTWRLTGADGALLGEAHQPLGPSRPGAADLAAIAKDGAQKIAGLLRGADSGTADLAASPHVFLQGLSVPRGIDGDGIARAMSRSLTLQGLVLDQQSPGFLIAGRMQVTPAGNGQDQVSLAWTVKSATGDVLGTVSQASPVSHGRLLGPLTSLAREITEAGAIGVMDVIRQKTGAPDSASHALPAGQPSP